MRSSIEGKGRPPGSFDGWLAIFAGPLIGALIAFALGHNDSWDLRNYHWYNPYALLHGRSGFDVAVAHHATYYNPLLDVPVWWLGHATSALGVAIVLGAIHGLNFTLVYLIARDAIGAEWPHRRVAAAAIALISCGGAYAVSLTGSVHHDNVVSLAVLFAVWRLVVVRDVLDEARPSALVGALALPAFLVGAAVGMKLPTAPFGLGLVVALFVAPSSWRARFRAAGVGGAAAAAGLLATAGWWSWKLWLATGNPLFPYFNDVIGSPLILDASYRDARFLPHTIGETLFYPFRAAHDWRVSSDWPVTDWRIAIAYLAVMLGSALLVTRGASPQPLIAPRVARPLFAFAAASYLSWLAVFAIYRYIVPLEFLAPVLIVAGVGLLRLGVRARVFLAGAALLCVLITVHIALPARRPFTPAMVVVEPPPIARPDRTLALMAGVEPMAFAIPSFPPSIAFLRVDGWLVGPSPETPMLRGMRDRIDAHLAARGDLFVLFEQNELDRARDVMALIDLRLTDECVPLRTNLVGSLRWCRVVRG